MQMCDSLLDIYIAILSCIIYKIIFMSSNFIIFVTITFSIKYSIVYSSRLAAGYQHDLNKIVSNRDIGLMNFVEIRTGFFFSSILNVLSYHILTSKTVTSLLLVTDI